MIQAIILLKILAMSWTITKFEPISWLLDLLPDNLFKYFLIVLTSCFKCCSLWFGIAFGGLWLGVTASIIAYTLTYISQKLKL